MPKINILTPDIISKIAAGEVIDRPASVIKELIENSIDAGANSISIELEDSGKKLIRVKDNGAGIAEEDMTKIFLRHSTSKIRSAEDLFDIHSLGFRGEALYSICAVSDIILRSRSNEQERGPKTGSGWEIHMRGGEQLNLSPCSLHDGTEIEVKELFFNTPARKKFLKSDSGEIKQILNTVIPYTLLNPECRFQLMSDRKNILNLEPLADLKARIADVLNLEEKFLLETSREFSEQGTGVRMILGDINIIRAKRDLQFIFINGRPVENKNISFHLNDVYRLILPPRHHPFFCLMIDMPPKDIDVNIHPTKREVKIRDEQELGKLLRRICEGALMSAGKPKQIWEPLENSKDSPRPGIRRMIDEAIKERGKQEAVFEKTADEFFTSQQQQPLTEQYSYPQDQTAEDFTGLLFQQKRQTLKDKLGSSVYVGSFMNKYIFFETGKNLLVVDQHAAQERIMFEQFIVQLKESRLEVQNLLAPYLLKASPQDLLSWRDNQQELSALGFDTNQFDDETIAIQSHPALIKNPIDAVRELLAGGQISRVDHESIARRACRASVMAGDPLNRQQAEFQREQLLQCRDPFTCPHGRPVVVEITSDFLDKQFLRT
ncbi:MAG: DNA mismatch repair endonuclease MutL [Candidatus Omnitrophota bacterium]